MYLNMIIPKFGGCSLTYDVTEGGADFILSFTDNKKIVLEVSVGKKDYKQIMKTTEKIKTKYSLVISNDDLRYAAEINVVKIPLKYFLLI